MKKSEMKNLKKEIKGILTNGWSESERKQWNDYLQNEVRSYNPVLYKFLTEK